MLKQLEAGNTLPSVTNLVAIADGAGVAIDVILGRAPLILEG